MREFAIGLNCKKNNCSCDKQIIHYTESTENIKPLYRLVYYIEYGYYKTKTPFCKIEYVIHPSSDRDEILNRLINKNQYDLDNAHLICEKRDVYLQYSESFYSECIKQLESMSGKLPLNFRESLFNNIKLYFDEDSIVKTWDIETIKEIAQETYLDINENS